jgi:hypothetical protein
MLSSAKMSTSSWGYYVRQEPCRAGDYYLGHGQDDGVWVGHGLEALGIEPGTVVTEQHLEALFGRALHPGTGQQLGRAWRADGVTGYDLTFSAPKSVSALTTDLLTEPDRGASRSGDRSEDWFGPPLPGMPEPAKPVRSQAMQDMLTEDALDAQREQRFQQAQRRVLPGLRSVPTGQAEAEHGSGRHPIARGSEVRGLVVAAHDTATRTALAYLNRYASLSRRGTNGVEQVATSGLTVAAFTHYTSREGDPQLHTHALLLNKVSAQTGPGAPWTATNCTRTRKAPA